MDNSSRLAASSSTPHHLSDIHHSSAEVSASRPRPAFGRAFQRTHAATTQLIKLAMRAAREDRAGSASAVQPPDALFRQQFSECAADPEAFHALMTQVYGPGHDRAAA